MPSITCPKCPTRLKVPDGTSGNGRCPKCGTVFPVNPSEVVEEPAPKPKAPAPPPKKVEEPDFAFVDEKPKNRAKAVVEEDDDEDEDERPRKKKKARDDDDDEPQAKKNRRFADDDDDDEDYRARKKKKKRRSGGGGVLAILGIALACLLLVAGLVWLLWPSGAANIRYFPDDSKVIASIKAEELLNSKAYKQIRDEFPPFEDDLMTESKFGLSVNDISSVLVGGNFEGKPDFVVVVQTKKSIKAEDMIAKAKDNKFTKETVGGYTLYTSGIYSFCVAESKVVLLGEAESVRSVLKRDGKPKLSDGMRAAMKETDFSKTFAVAIDTKGLMSQQGRAGPRRGGVPFAQEANEYLKDVEGFAGWVSVRTDIDAKFTVIFKDGNAAADAKKLLDGLAVMAKKTNEVPPEVIEMIEKTEFRLSGNRVEVIGRIEVAKLLKAIKSARGRF